MNSSNKLLNSSTSPLKNNPFGILDKSGSTVSVFGIPTGSMNSTPKSIGIQPTMTIKVNSMTFSTHTTDNHQPKSLMTFLPQWIVKTIEVVGQDAGNLNIGQQTYSQKYCGNVSLMAHVLDTYDPDTYVDA